MTQVLIKMHYFSFPVIRVLNKMLPIYFRYNLYSSSSNFRNSSLFTDIHNNSPLGRGVSDANHMHKDINIFRKHVTSLKQILHYSVTLFHQLTYVFSGFWVFAPVLHLYCFYPARVFLFCLFSVLFLCICAVLVLYFHLCTGFIMGTYAVKPAH
jgi:hypothetical protein